MTAPPPRPRQHHVRVVVVGPAGPVATPGDPAAPGGVTVSFPDVWSRAARLVSADPDVEVTLLPPPGTAATAGPVVDPSVRVRSDRHLPERRAVEALARGTADAAVCFGDPRLLAAAASFVLGHLRGVTRASLAVRGLGPRGDDLLVDATPGRAGSAEQSTADAALAAAVAGALGRPTPRVVALAAGDPPAAPPGAAAWQARVAATVPLCRAADWAADWVGGAPADVAVTDGGAGALLVDALAPRAAAPTWWVLGVPAVVVAGPAHAPAPAVAAAVGLAAAAVRADLVGRSRAALEDVVADRRRAAGLAP